MTAGRLTLQASENKRHLQHMTTIGRLAAVVVTFNRLDQLQVTVQRLLDSRSHHLETLLVVNNASTDGTGDWLDGLTDPRVHIEHLPDNRGGAGGFEYGLRVIHKQHDPDWVVVMDDDGRPASGALATFHGLDLEDWDAVAAAVYFPDGDICDINRPSRNPFWHGRVFWKTVLGTLSGGLLGQARDGFHVVQADYDSDQMKPVDGASFVGLFVSRAALARHGYPDGRLFIYGDDVLYTLGLRAAGGNIAFCPTVRFEHDFSTIAKNDRRFRPLWKTYYHHRNLLFVYRRAAGWLFWPVLLLVLPKWLLKTFHHKGERGVFLKLMAYAIRDGLLRRTDMAHEDVLTLAGGNASGGR